MKLLKLSDEKFICNGKFTCIMVIYLIVLPMDMNLLLLDALVIENVF